jgi:hypothetical protein
MLSMTYKYSGYSDYWSGNGDRWDDNKGCLFAFYGPNTTLRDLEDQLVHDFIMGSDCDQKQAFDDISESDIRKAFQEMLSPDGREDYRKGVLWEGASELEDWSDDYESPIFVVLVEVENA